MVKFIKATCPSCGGQLQIPDDLTKAFCPYCGATVILEWEGRPGPGPTVASYMKLGIAAMQGLNYTDAYEYFAKALELNPNHREAWLWKGVAAGGCYEQHPKYAELTQGKFDEAMQCLRQSGFTHDEMVALLVGGLRTSLPESNQAIVGWGGFTTNGTGLLGIAYWAPPDLALLYLDTAAKIEPSAIRLEDYWHCIQEAGRAYRIDLVRSFAESAITLAPGGRSGVAHYIYVAAVYSRAFTTETLNKAASLLELALQIDPAAADKVAGCYHEERDYEYGQDFWGRPKKRGYVRGGYLDLANWAAEAGLPELAEQYLKRALEIAQNKNATRKGVNIIKRGHGLKRPAT